MGKSGKIGICKEMFQSTSATASLSILFETNKKEKARRCRRCNRHSLASQAIEKERGSGSPNAELVPAVVIFRQRPRLRHYGCYPKGR